MTKRSLLLLAFFALFVGGAAVGFFVRRRHERIDLPPHRVRSGVVEHLLGEFERSVPVGSEGLPSWRNAEFAGPPSGIREDDAELELVSALCREGMDGLKAIDRKYPGTHAAARAHWETILRMPEGAARDGLLGLFRRHHPDAWVLIGGDAR